MKLTKTDRVLKFKQSDWMKKYIDLALKREKKRFFKIDDQFCLWKNDEKFMKKNQCEIID